MISTGGPKSLNLISLYKLLASNGGALAQYKKTESAYHVSIG